jgi:hypothetical protein
MESHAKTFFAITSKRRLRVIEKLLELSISGGGFHSSNVWFLRTLLLVNNPNVWDRGVQCLLSGFDRNPGDGMTRFNSAEQTVIDRKCFSLVVLMPQGDVPESWRAPSKGTNVCFDMVSKTIAEAPVCVLRTRKTQSFPTLCHPISGMPMTRVVLFGDEVYDTMGFPLPQLSYNGAGEITVTHDGQAYSVPAMTLGVSVENMALYGKTLGTLGSYGFWATDLVLTQSPIILKDLCESWGLPRPTVHTVSCDLDPGIMDTTIITDYFLEGAKKPATRLVLTMDFRGDKESGGGGYTTLGRLKEPKNVMINEAFGPF